MSILARLVKRIDPGLLICLRHIVPQGKSEVIARRPQVQEKAFMSPVLSDDGALQARFLISFSKGDEQDETVLDPRIPVHIGRPAAVKSKGGTELDPRMQRDPQEGVDTEFDPRTCADPQFGPMRRDDETPDTEYDPRIADGIPTEGEIKEDEVVRVRSRGGNSKHEPSVVVDETQLYSKDEVTEFYEGRTEAFGGRTEVPTEAWSKALNAQLPINDGRGPGGVFTPNPKVTSEGLFTGKRARVTALALAKDSQSGVVVKLAKLRQELAIVSTASAATALAGSAALFFLTPVGVAIAAATGVLAGALTFLGVRSVVVKLEKQRFAAMFDHAHGRELLAQALNRLGKGRVSFELSDELAPLENLTQAVALLAQVRSKQGGRSTDKLYDLLTVLGDDPINSQTLTYAKLIKLRDRM